MEKIMINTGLNSFVMPDKITKTNEKSIEALKTFKADNFNFLTKIETIAQICALHTRFLLDFKQHAFLLKIDEFTDNSGKNDYGDYSLYAKIQSSGKTAFSYSISAKLNNKEKFSGKLIIATSDYNEKFNKQILTKHYRKIFSCLTKNSAQS